MSSTVILNISKWFAEAKKYQTEKYSVYEPPKKSYSKC